MADVTVVKPQAASDVKILYAGVGVCDDARVAARRDDEVEIETASPMPVGTALEVDTGGGPLSARVVEAIEGAPGTMRLSTRAGDRAERPAPAGEKKKGRKKA